jgi:hypothetical protein
MEIVILDLFTRIKNMVKENIFHKVGKYYLKYLD